MQGLDPRCTETGPQGTRPQDPASQTRTRDFAEIQDFVGLGTSWDLGLRGTQDFVGFKTSPDSGLRGIQDFSENRNFAGPRPGSCSVVFSKRTQTFRINLKHGHHLV